MEFGNKFLMKSGWYVFPITSYSNLPNVFLFVGELEYVLPYTALDTTPPISPSFLGQYRSLLCAWYVSFLCKPECESNLRVVLGSDSLHPSIVSRIDSQSE